ncbi:MAG TPA: DNA repair protein RadC [Firmicutes bacterium]|nr:DNA repair protein RadC [Candidatus Fermentithermobacillaceae bacterium]
MTIKDWPSEDKPRERLFRVGAEALSDAELIAILLGTGNPRETAMDISRRMLALSEEKYGTSLGFLSGLSLEELKEIAGVGPAKVARIKAGVELGRRLYRGVKPGGRPFTVRCGRDVYEYVKTELTEYDRECFAVILLNTRNQVLSKEVESVGSLDASLVHPREIFKNAIRRNAASMVLVHNHPSGDPSPSDDDIEITKKLVEAGKILGISVFDHVIVSRSSFVSLREISPGWFL